METSAAFGAGSVLFRRNLSNVFDLKNNENSRNYQISKPYAVARHPLDINSNTIVRYIKEPICTPRQ